MSEAAATMPAPIDRFVRPNLLWNLLLQPGLGLLTAMAVSEPVYEQVQGRVPVPPRRTVQVLAAGAVGLHAFEARSAYRKARRLGLDRSAKRWAFEAFLLGFPVLLKLSSSEVSGRQ